MIKCELCLKDFGKSNDFNIIHWSHLKRIHGITRSEYIKLFPDSKLCTEELLNKVGQTEEKMIQRYGEIEGKHRWELYREKQAYTNTKEYFIEKYGNIDGIQKYTLANKNRAITLSNCIKKYGDKKGIEIFNNYREKQAYTNTKEYFIKKYGELDGNKKYYHNNFLKSHTYESYLYRFNGDEEKALYELKRYFSAKNIYNQSKIAIDLFDNIRDILINNGFKKIFYESYTQEWYLNISKYGFVKLDFFVKETNKVIEFYGDYWHANPLLYNSNDYVHYPQKKQILASEIWHHDKRRIDAIKSSELISDVMIVWEYDYVNNKDEIIKNCIKFIMGL